MSIKENVSKNNNVENPWIVKKTNKKNIDIS